MPNTINQPYLIDMETGKTLMFQSVPTELMYSSGITWVTIASAGRNNPLYQYTGAEDSIAFTLSWYAEEESRQDVLTKCKWLESLGKNDGYDNKPHRIKLVFGKLFSDAIWIVSSADYKISMFNRLKGMLPTLAMQEVILKRVMITNRTTNQIRKLET